MKDVVMNVSEYARLSLPERLELGAAAMVRFGIALRNEGMVVDGADAVAMPVGERETTSRSSRSPD